MDDRSLWTSQGHDKMPFSFPGLLRESISAMGAHDNRRGLAAIATAIPAARAAIDAL